MSSQKRIFYIRSLGHQTFADVIAKQPDIKLEKIDNALPDAAALSIIGAGHVLQTTSVRDDLIPEFHMGEWLLSRAPHLLAVSTHGAGYDSIDMKACTRAGVLVVNQAGGNAEAVAEHALGMLLCLTKRIVETDHVMRRALIPNRAVFMGDDALGKTIGIVGLGHVGTRLAELCNGLLRMRVLGYDPYVTAQQMKAKGVEKVELEALLRQADYVSVNSELTDETANMMNAQRFALMQKHAYFIITARGGIVDEAALAEALAQKQIAGAGIDVWEKEPPSPDHPLMKFDNVVVSPHLAGVSKEGRTYSAQIAAEQAIDILNGKRPPRLLNPDVWPAYEKRFETMFGRRPT